MVDDQKRKAIADEEPTRLDPRDVVAVINTSPDTVGLLSDLLGVQGFSS